MPEVCSVPELPDLARQADRLIDFGVHELAGVSAARLRAAAAPEVPGSLLVLPAAPISKLAPLVELGGKHGFVVTDMSDVDEFAPIPSVRLPDSPAYRIETPDRGDDLAECSPNEALPMIEAAGRTPLTLAEGLHWLLQCPDVLERNYCFMTIASRKHRLRGSPDARTPAIWISNGTGRDGAANRDAPKVGWCWAGNRHTWLGFASAAGRSG